MSGADPLPDELAADPCTVRLRGSTRQPPAVREVLAERLWERLHPAMSALGLLFVVLVLAQGPAREGTALQRSLLAATWVLWAVFAVEYALRFAVAPSKGAFLRRTWWQLLLLVVPVLTLFRALLVLRVARPTRVALAAVRGGRSARATLTSRTAWLGIVTAIVVFAAADVLYGVGGMRPYGAALHAAALAAVTGEPTGSERGVAQVLDVALALYAVVFFASLAGILGAYFLERREDDRAQVQGTRCIGATAEPSSTA